MPFVCKIRNHQNYHFHFACYRTGSDSHNRKFQSILYKKFLVFIHIMVCIRLKVDTSTIVYPRMKIRFYLGATIESAMSTNTKHAKTKLRSQIQPMQTEAHCTLYEKEWHREV